MVLLVHFGRLGGRRGRRCLAERNAVSAILRHIIPTKENLMLADRNSNRSKLVFRAVALTGAGALLSACATPSVQRPRDVQTTYLICAKTIPLDISHDGKTAVVRNWQGKQVTLKRNLAAAGTRYEGAGVTVMRQDGVYVYVASDGSTHACDPLRN